MKKLMNSIATNDLRMYVVWLPMLRTDSKVAAVEAARELSDARVQHFWDETRWSADTWGGVLVLGAAAWDVYMVYGRDAAWSDHPAYPAFWMHQLGSVASSAPALSFDELKRQVERLLSENL